MATGGLKGGWAAATKALRASGVIVRVEPEEFFRLLHRQQQPPLVVQAVASAWFVTTHYQYLTSYRGLAFYAQSHTPLALPLDCEIVEAGSIWIPA